MFKRWAVSPPKMAEKKAFAHNFDTSLLVRNLVTGFEQMSDYQRELLDFHKEQPQDAIVADDVSGRVPTLIAHRFLRMALHDDKVERVPRTYFMASGRLRRTATNNEDLETVDADWSKALENHVAKLVGWHAIKTATVITEMKGGGKSLKRIGDAFQTQGVETRQAVMELSGSLFMTSNSDRVTVGVEKSPPEAISTRHSRFDSQQSSSLRYFLDEYTALLYRHNFKS